MPVIFTVANQKGGVAKTTTVHALGAALAEQGRHVLLFDLDPQDCLTFSLGIDPNDLPKSLHDVFVHRAPATEILLKVGELHLLPATIDLAGTEVHMLTRAGREYALARALDPIKNDYDTILVDCPPSLGVLTINGLTAADEVLIPLQCETLSHRGVGQLLETIEDVKSYTNPGLKVRGVIATMFDARTRLGREVLAMRRPHAAAARFSRRADGAVAVDAVASVLSPDALPGVQPADVVQGALAERPRLADVSASPSRVRVRRDIEHRRGKPRG